MSNMAIMSIAGAVVLIPIKAVYVGVLSMTKKCKRCLQDNIAFGVNVFEAITGSHVKTQWYCRFCAKVLRLIDE